MHELLAPAGDMECLKTAIRFGADAVYVGGPFLQLRADKVGFTEETLKEAIEYVHRHNKKIYVTVNSFAKNDEIDRLGVYARKLYEMNVDAVIVSDIGAVAEIHESVPELEIHISTQANCQNYKSACVYYAMGAKRIVLGRELTLDEIIEIKRNIPEDLELEVFVHGAMCMAYSGRCLISSYMTDRSGNRGECTQPCRWNYHLLEHNRPNEFFEVEETPNGTAIMSSHDLKCIGFLDKLMEAGIDSFKIEGRMKTPYYVATVTNAYRRRIDGTAPPDVLDSELDCVSHRPYSEGFYFGKMKREHFNSGAYEQSCIFAAVVLENTEGRIKIEQRNKFKTGDVFEVVSPRGIGESFVVSKIETLDGEIRENAPHPKEQLYIDCSLELEAGDILRVRTE